MARTFYCPRCDGILNPGSKVIFVVEHGSERGLVLLSPELGDYATVLARSLVLPPGTVCTFRCPICRAELTSPVEANLVEVVTRDEQGAAVRVDFSRVVGEHATFVRGARGVERYGEHASRYESVNFFGAGVAPATDGE